MFELVLTLCVATSQGSGCVEQISPKTAAVETCQTAGEFMATVYRLRMEREGIEGTVSFVCRIRGQDV